MLYIVIIQNRLFPFPFHNFTAAAYIIYVGMMTFVVSCPITSESFVQKIVALFVTSYFLTKQRVNWNYSNIISIPQNSIRSIIRQPIVFYTPTLFLGNMNKYLFELWMFRVQKNVRLIVLNGRFESRLFISI